MRYSSMAILLTILSLAQNSRASEGGYSNYVPVTYGDFGMALAPQETCTMRSDVYSYSANIDESIRSDRLEAEAKVNFKVSTAVLSELASAITSPRRLRVAEVSARPPSVASLLFSELKSPVLSTAKANTEATTTKAMRTMAVSRPVIPCWFGKNVPIPRNCLVVHFLMERSLSAARLPGRRRSSAIIS